MSARRENSKEASKPDAGEYKSPTRILYSSMSVRRIERTPFNNRSDNINYIEQRTRKHSLEIALEDSKCDHFIDLNQNKLLSYYCSITRNNENGRETKERCNHFDQV